MGSDWFKGEAPRSALLSLALVAGTLLAGLAIRFGSLGLPGFVMKYGGSTLWALLIYWFVSASLSRWRVAVVAIVTAVITAGVEFLKLYHTPGLDAFRLTLPGILLLGRFFAWWDIAAYWLAIAVGAFWDGRLRPWPRASAAMKSDNLSG